jgi:hypothetical protein
MLRSSSVDPRAVNDNEATANRRLSAVTWFVMNNWLGGQAEARDVELPRSHESTVGDAVPSGFGRLA